MDIGIISSRYAKSLLAYATEEKKEERLYREMEMLSQSYQEVQTVRPFSSKESMRMAWSENFV